MAVMMKCGHRANAMTPEGKPCCAICAGLTEDAFEVVASPSLEGRKAMCSMCSKKTDSRLDLPFFEYRPDKEIDLYYCGCLGWD